MRSLTIRRVFARTAAAVVVALLFASLVGVAHTHAGAGWGRSLNDCPTCLFKQHTPSASGKPPVGTLHLAFQQNAALPALPPRSFAPLFRSLGRAPPPFTLSPRS